MAASLKYNVLQTTICVCFESENDPQARHTLESELNMSICDCLARSSQGSPRYVDMLEAQNSMTVEALYMVYKLCIEGKSFPSGPLAASSEGQPLTHAI